MPSPRGRWPARVHGTDCTAAARPRGGNFAWDSPGCAIRPARGEYHASAVRQRRAIQLFLPGTAGVSWRGRRVIFEPSQTSGSYLRVTTRSFMGMIALSVILMFSGQTSVQHLVM